MPTPPDTLELTKNNQINLESNLSIKQIDDELSKRFIALDPAGYFIIYIEPAQNLICAKHFTNEVNAKGLAVDPETGKVIPARGKVNREPTYIFQARTAKELCVKIFENSAINLVTMLDHASYIGREAQKAEWALHQQQEYIQD
jgi:dihydropteroate synthase